MWIEFGGARVRFVEGDTCHLADLTNEGEATDLAALWKQILTLAKGRPLRCVVTDGPDMKRLLESYQKLGFVPYGILMEKQ